MKTNTLNLPQPFLSRCYRIFSDSTFKSVKFCWLIMLFLLVSKMAFGQWEEVPLPQTGVSFKKMAIVDNHKWLIYGRYVYKTSDNGQTWTVGDSDVHYSNDIYFINRDTGFVVGEYDKVSRTYDGGATWTLLSVIDTYTNLQTIHFVGNKGWIAGYDGTILQTDDFGENWTKVSLPYSGEIYYRVFLDKIHFINENIGFVYGKYFSSGFYKTINGGNTWRYYPYKYDSGQYTYERDLYLCELYFKNDLEGIAYGNSDTYLTTDGGITWKGTDYQSLHFRSNVFFFNDLVGWAIHNTSEISHTLNGGRTWTSQRERTNYTLHDIAMDADQNIWAIGDAGQLLENRRGGEIGVSFNQIFIENHDSTATFLDSTDFGQITIPQTKSFTITNINTDTLILDQSTPVSIDGSPLFQIVEQPHDTLFSGDSTQFKVAFTPNGNPATASISIKSNAKKDSLFDFMVQGNCTECLIEGEEFVCTAAKGLIYSAPAGMKNYHWEVNDDRWATIVGSDSSQTVEIDVYDDFDFELSLVAEEFNGCKTSCLKEISAGLPTSNYWTMLGPTSLCENQSLVRFVIPGLISQGDSSLWLAKEYKWSIANGDAEIVGADSLYEVYINTKSIDFTLELTMRNYPDCETTTSRTIDVHETADYNLCGLSEICSDTEFAIYSGPEDLSDYRWTATNVDSIFFTDTSGTPYIRIDSLSKDFTVNLSTTTSAGCVFNKEIAVTVGADCSFQLNNIVYVNANLTTGNQDGSSWQNAFNNLQDALDIATENDQIWIAEGVYYPTKDKTGAANPEDIRTRTFSIDKTIQLFGGFAGTESSLAERDWTLNETILSGDLNGDDEYLFPDVSTTNTLANNIDDNVYTVVNIASSGPNTRLDGLTIRGGNADFRYTEYNYFDEKNAGGGVYIEGDICGMESRPTFENCLITHNRASNNGAGILARSSNRAIVNPTILACKFTFNNGGGLALISETSNVLDSEITNCEFLQNRGNQGGGVYIYVENGSAIPIFRNCIFKENRASTGGAISVYAFDGGADASPEFYDCQIIANTSSWKGGGVAFERVKYWSTGGEKSNIPYFERVAFKDNKADQGGGIYFDIYTNNNFPTINNCVFLRNEGADKGGAIYQNVRSGAIFSLVYNSTFAYNKAPLGGVIYKGGGYSNYFYIYNGIIWKNATVDFYNEYGNNVNLRHSLLEDSNCPSGASCLDGNIFGKDPLFVDDVNDFRLQANSPAIDTGLNSITREWKVYELDLDNNPRMVAGGRVDTPRVDLGAYEFQSTPILQVKYDTQLVNTTSEYVLYDTLYTDDEPTYCIDLKNVGVGDLMLTSDPIVDFQGDSDFQVLYMPTSSTLTALAEDSLKLKFSALTVGDFQATLSIPHSVDNGEPHTSKLLINVMQRPDTPRLKIILLEGGLADLRDSTLKESFCTKFQRDYIFEVENTGTETVQFQDDDPVSLVGNSYYKITEQLEVEELLIGEKDTFNISYDTRFREGTHNANLSIAYNALDDLPYEFGLQNTVFACPDTTDMEVYYDNGGPNVDLATHSFVDTICWGESKLFGFRVQNMSLERLEFPDNHNAYSSSNSLFSKQTFSLFDVRGLETEYFSMRFSADDPGTYETNISIPYNSRDGNPYTFNWKVVVLPYDTPEEQALCDEISQWAEKNRAILSIKDSLVNLGDEFCIPIYNRQTYRIIVMESIIQWDYRKLTYKGFNNLQLPLRVESDLSTEVYNDSILIVKWLESYYNGIDFADNEPLYELCFQPIEVGTTTIQFIDDTITSPYFYDRMLGPYGRDLKPVYRDGHIQIQEHQSDCQDNININEQDMLTNTRYRAKEMIEANVTIEPDMFVTFQAGDSIILNTGFHVMAGSNFKAEIMEMDCLEEDTKIESRNTNLELVKLGELLDLNILPNPFHQSSTIQYQLEHATAVRLQIFSADGSLVEELVKPQTQAKGYYEYTFEPKTTIGGMYFVTLTTPDAVLNKKIIFIR